jgi:hypothetical protein
MVTHQIAIMNIVATDQCSHQIVATDQIMAIDHDDRSNSTLLLAKSDVVINALELHLHLGPASLHRCKHHTVQVRLFELCMQILQRGAASVEHLGDHRLVLRIGQTRHVVQRCPDLQRLVVEATQDVLGALRRCRLSLSLRLASRFRLARSGNCTNLDQPR